MSNQFEEDRKTIGRARQDYKKVAKIYEEYRRLRRMIKPDRYPLDPERIKEDLSSEDFFKGLLG
jgi:hypothetical protein